MLGISWWGWVIAVVVVIVVLMRSAMRSYRRSIRRQFIEFLKLKDPSLEILREADDRLLYKAEGVDEATIFLHKLYSAITSLKPDTPNARLQNCEHYFGVLREHRDSLAPLELAKHGERIKPRLAPPGFFK